MHVQAGLGPVKSQVELFDGATFVARTDLHLVGTNRYPECDGGEHRTRERHEHDLQRDKGLHRIGAERFGYTTAEIAHQPDMIIRDAESARRQTPDPARTSNWWRVARQSTLTGHGRARLRGRLIRYRLAASQRELVVMSPTAATRRAAAWTTGPLTRPAAAKIAATTSHPGQPHVTHRPVSTAGASIDEAANPVLNRPWYWP
jgi:hypothetical protein